MSISLVLVYFVYGLSFLVMGLAILLETGRSPALAEARSLRWLAAFGLIHGVHEWLESYLLQAEAFGTRIPPWLPWLRLGFLIASFISLFIYAYLTLKLVSPKYEGHQFFHFGRLGLYEAAVIAILLLTDWRQPIAWQTLVDGAARYMLAVPAALLAALALHAQGRRFREEGRPRLASSLGIAVVGFIGYGAGQIFVHGMEVFPAIYVNQEAFLAVTGIPIQLLRTVMAILITIGLVRASQLVEKERQIQLTTAHQARLEALEQRDSLRRELLQHTVHAQEEERSRIARELHDETAQVLSAFTLELATLRKTLKRADTTLRVDHLQVLARQMSQGIYHLVYDLRPAQLDDLGLVAALNFLISQDCCPKGMDIALEVGGNQRRLDPLVETVLFRVAQEALNNVVRHSEARQAKIRIQYAETEVIMQITDPGRGFDPEENFHPPRGWGLAGMRERVESLNGKLNLRSAPGRGTTVEVCLPLIPANREEGNHGSNHLVIG